MNGWGTPYVKSVLSLLKIREVIGTGHLCRREKDSLEVLPGQNRAYPERERPALSLDIFPGIPGLVIPL
jgi:hypothetical protein